MSRLHIIEGGIHARHYIIIFADKIRIVGIAVLFICVSNLRCQLVHTHGAVFVLLEIRCLDENIVAGDVRGGNIVNHLLAVGGISIIDILFHTGSELRRCTFKYIVCFRFKISVVCRK